MYKLPSTELFLENLVKTAISRRSIEAFEQVEWHNQALRCCSSEGVPSQQEPELMDPQFDIWLASWNCYFNPNGSAV